MSAVKSGRIPNAYLFVGDDSASLIDEALQFAGGLNCFSPSDKGCGACSSCEKISKKIHPDILVVRPSPNSIGIDQIRETSKFVRFGPVLSKWKIIIIEKAEAMSEEASNAFLKTLEEPLNNVLFILTTIREAMVLKTISSRCQKLIFSSVARATDPEADQLARNLMDVKNMNIERMFALSEEISSLDAPEETLNQALNSYRTQIEVSSKDAYLSMKHILRGISAISRRANKRLAMDAMLLSMKGE